MFVLKNAWSAMGRHKARTALLALTAIAVSFGSVVGLSILNANTVATTTTYNDLNPAVTFRADRARIIKKYGGDISKVDWTKYHLSWAQYSDYVQRSGVSIANAYSAETAKISINGVKATKSGATLAMTGFSDATAAGAAINGKFTIVSGKNISYAEDTAGTLLVPKALADANKLKAGDTLKITNPKDASYTQSMVITGIYENEEDVDADATGIDPDNTIYASAYTLSMLGLASTGSESTENDLDVSMVLNSPADFSKFEKGVRKAGLSKDFIIASATIDDYNAKIEPLKQLAAKTRPAVIALFVVGAVVALLLVWSATSSRLRLEDAGFLRVIGISSGRVGWQFALEAMMPMLLGWIIGTVAGAFSASPISNRLATAANAAPNADVIWTMVWIGLGALLATIIVCEIRSAMIRPQSILATRMEEAR
ncbi:hypothetical protein CS006_02850 [Bifidobacterium primatium]|uniref:ABC3 transporter permease C-terminal domain-containing protein n=1 Tax=Bifidobacterium primatium TaxID=2045438 RepID=A0A2M9HBA3_9BIFI|nr:ABC transporter permease [Bifidobacterium primatium]PJM74095.1 hypothetical protein CS006_02850 [Bifidobacterium primatium]